MNSIILVQDTANSMGGVETLVARLARHFTSEGIEVTVLVLSSECKPRPLKSLPDNCRLILYDPTASGRCLYPRSFWSKALRAALPSDCDLIMSFSAAGASAMRCIRRAHYPEAFELFYVVHPHMFRPERDSAHYSHLAAMRSLQAESIVFMNDSCVKSNNWKSGKKTILAPLPILPFDAQRAGSGSLMKIVSVGRVDRQMKAYNWALVPVVAQISRKRQVKWDVYGGGGLAEVEDLRKQIIKHGVEEQIVLHGEISEDQIPAVLDGATCFIGMGTALVQAASCGIPAMSAIAYEKDPLTYGWFCDLRFPEVGEDMGDAFKKHRMEEFLDYAQSLDQGALEDLGKRCREHSLKFSIAEFGASLKSAISGTFRPQRIDSRYIVKIWASHQLMRLKSRFAKYKRHEQVAKEVSFARSATDGQGGR